MHIMDRKNKSSSQFHKKPRSTPSKTDQHKRKHILSKPNTKLAATKKFTQSSSTLHSHNLSKTSTKKNNTTTNHTQLQGEKRLCGLVKEISDTVSFLSRQFVNFQMENIGGNQCGNGVGWGNRAINWCDIVTNLAKSVKNQKLKQLLELTQKGHSENLCCQQSTSNKKLKNLNKTKNDISTLQSQPKKRSKLLIQQQKTKNFGPTPFNLNLNIANIDKQNIKDYHDEFMGKIDQFSPSWREMLELEKKRTC